MLTGDNHTTAEAVARRLGIDEVEADVPPDQKGAVVGRLKSEGRVVAMASDGVNDAPALAVADVGIAMGLGTDATIESADVTLLRGDLLGIVKARRLSEATMRNIRQNFVFAFIYNAAGVPVAAVVLYPVFGVLLSPIITAVAMALSSAKRSGWEERGFSGGNDGGHVQEVVTKLNIIAASPLEDIRARRVFHRRMVFLGYAYSRSRDQLRR